MKKYNLDPPNGQHQKAIDQLSHHNIPIINQSSNVAYMQRKPNCNIS